jgi:hypothetical protein
MSENLSLRLAVESMDHLLIRPPGVKARLATSIRKKRVDLCRNSELAKRNQFYGEEPLGIRVFLIPKLREQKLKLYGRQNAAPLNLLE